MNIRWTTVCRWLPAAALLAGATAWADPLPPVGTLIGPAGTTVAAEPQLAGTVVEDVITPFSYDGWRSDSGSGETVVTHGNVTGTVQSRVVLSVDGTYDFYWRIHVDADSFLPVLGFNITGFPAVTYNANWRSDGLGSVQPGEVGQGPTGIGWGFGVFAPPSHQIYQGEESYFIFLDTQAHGYTHAGQFSLGSGRDSGGSMMINWGGSSGAYATFAPAVPEPASAVLLLAGLAACGVYRKVRRSRAAFGHAARFF